MTNSELVLDWYEQLWHQGNEAVIDRIMHTDCRAHGLAKEVLIGREHFRQFYRAFRARFPHVRIEVKKIIEQGEFVSLRGKATLHDTDGRPYEMHGSLMAQFRNGVCIEAWDNWDFLGLLIQMGAVSPNAMAEAMSGGNAQVPAG